MVSDPEAGMKSDNTQLVDATLNQRTLVNALQTPAPYPHPVKKVRLLETHISYVLLTGNYAYKIKKAVNFGFLDFSRLDQRRFYCEEELRLNRRLVPQLYLEVVPISDTNAGPRIGDEGEPTEYAVKMLEFPQDALLDRRLSAGNLSPDAIDALAERVADFHVQVAKTGARNDYGSPATVWPTVANTLSQLRAAVGSTFDNTLLDKLETWSRSEYGRLGDFFVARHREGFVRECHGDLHLGNIAWIQGAPQIFDCIEFNPNLRWIDVMSEVAFLCMDLQERGRPDYAHRFLNRYLEVIGDYAGVRCLSFYQVYRALVRAMVASIRAAQEEAGGAQAAVCTQYLGCASRSCLPKVRQLLLMHGMSGTGKTWVSQAVLERTGALRLRSDIERKRLCGLPALARTGSTVDGGLYDEEATQATYRRLRQLAQLVLEAGFPVVVDAASLKFWQREMFRSLARTLNVPFRILSCHAAEPLLRQRLRAREQAGSDASEAGIAILAHQIESSEPLSADELEEVIRIDSENYSLVDFLHRIVRQPDGQRSIVTRLTAANHQVFEG